MNALGKPKLIIAMAEPCDPVTSAADGLRSGLPSCCFSGSVLASMLLQQLCEGGSVLASLLFRGHATQSGVQGPSGRLFCLVIIRDTSGHAVYHHITRAT